MKMALQYRLNRGEPGRTRFLSFRGGYHGDTFAAMSVCDPEEGMHRLFGAMLPKQLLASLPNDAASTRDFERTVAAHAHELTALIVEPLVQAAGGMRFHSPETLARVAATARRFDLLLIFDEIAVGFGRTGTLFACEQAEVVPDIITLSKALTGGTLPLAATVASTRVYEAFFGDRRMPAIRSPARRRTRPSIYSRPSRVLRRSRPSRGSSRKVLRLAADSPPCATFASKAQSASSSSRARRSSTRCGRGSSGTAVGCARSATSSI